MITDIQNEALLDRLFQYLNLNWKEDENLRKKTISGEIADLILKINDGLPESTLVRYNELMKKSVNENLTQEEHKEYLELVPVIEDKNAERLGYLVKLSGLWNCSVDETMQKLGITTPPPIYS